MKSTAAFALLLLGIVTPAFAEPDVGAAGSSAFSNGQASSVLGYAASAKSIYDDAGDDDAPPLSGSYWERHAQGINSKWSQKHCDFSKSHSTKMGNVALWVGACIMASCAILCLLGIAGHSDKFRVKEVGQMENDEAAAFYDGFAYKDDSDKLKDFTTHPDAKLAKTRKDNERFLRSVQEYLRLSPTKVEIPGALEESGLGRYIDHHKDPDIDNHYEWYAKEIRDGRAGWDTANQGVILQFLRDHGFDLEKDDKHCEVKAFITVQDRSPDLPENRKGRIGHIYVSPFDESDPTTVESKAWGNPKPAQGEAAAREMLMPNEAYIVEFKSGTKVDLEFVKGKFLKPRRAFEGKIGSVSSGLVSGLFIQCNKKEPFDAEDGQVVKINDTKVNWDGVMVAGVGRTFSRTTGGVVDTEPLTFSKFIDKDGKDLVITDKLPLMHQDPDPKNQAHTPLTLVEDGATLRLVKDTVIQGGKKIDMCVIEPNNQKTEEHYPLEGSMGTITRVFNKHGKLVRDSNSTNKDFYDESKTSTVGNKSVLLLDAIEETNYYEIEIDQDQATERVKQFLDADGNEPFHKQIISGQHLVHFAPAELKLEGKFIEYDESDYFNSKSAALLPFITCAIAACAYFTMANDQYGISIVGEHCQQREFYFARYIDWLITTPIMLYELQKLALSSVNTSEKKGENYTPIGFFPVRKATEGYSLSILLLVDALMVLLGLAGVYQVDGHRYAYFAVGFILFLLISTHIMSTLRFWKGDKKHPQPDAASTYEFAAKLTFFAWAIYPFVWMLCEGQRRYSVDSEIIMYLVLDVLSKGVWGLWIVSKQSKVFNDRQEELGMFVSGVMRFLSFIVLVIAGFPWNIILYVLSLRWNMFKRDALLKVIEYLSVQRVHPRNSADTKPIDDELQSLRVRKTMADFEHEQKGPISRFLYALDPPPADEMPCLERTIWFFGAFGYFANCVLFDDFLHFENIETHGSLTKEHFTEFDPYEMFLVGWGFGVTVYLLGVVYLVLRIDRRHGNIRRYDLQAATTEIADRCLKYFTVTVDEKVEPQETYLWMPVIAATLFGQFCYFFFSWFKSVTYTVACAPITSADMCPKPAFLSADGLSCCSANKPEFDLMTFILDLGANVVAAFASVKAAAELLLWGDSYPRRNESLFALLLNQIHKVERRVNKTVDGPERRELLKKLEERYHKAQEERETVIEDYQDKQREQAAMNEKISTQVDDLRETLTATRKALHETEVELKELRRASVEEAKRAETKRVEMAERQKAMAEEAHLRNYAAYEKQQSNKSKFWKAKPDVVIEKGGTASEDGRTQWVVKPNPKKKSKSALKKMKEAHLETTTIPTPVKAEYGEDPPAGGSLL